ncbi:MAG: tetratricopeptide repeat protein [Polyangiales bacterium]
MAAFALPVAADELSDFESARRQYDKQNYPKAARALESLVGGAVPRAANPVVRIEARKYLGATYLFLGKKEAAREQFRRLLEEDPDYDIDPVAFPGAVVQTFQEVQAEFARERAHRDARDAARQQRERSEEVEQLIVQQQRIKMLEELAATETVEKQNSRWIAAIPFGAGQFQNGDRKLGIMFATVESALLAASIATFIGHNSLRDENPSPEEIDRARRVEKALRIGNWVSVGAFLSFAVAGVVEAEVRFKPVIRTTRKRELPNELRAPQSTGPQIRLELGLTGGKMRLDF